MITEELMQNLFRFQAHGDNFENFRCCFPSETYANLPSIVTGATPTRHSIIVNTMCTVTSIDACTLSVLGWIH